MKDATQLLNKISGSVKLESADPTWQRLLSCGSFASADGIAWENFLDNIVQNNPRTANVLTLLELITSTVLSSVSHRAIAAEGNAFTGNVGMLHLCLIIITHFMSVLNSQELRMQLFLPQEWPSKRCDDETSGNAVGTSAVGSSGRVIVESLVTTLCNAVTHTLSSAPTIMQGKIYMVKLFCVDILVSLCTSPQFQTGSSEPSNMEKSSIFMRYIFLRGDNDNSDAGNAAVKRGSSLQSLSAASNFFAPSTSSAAVPSSFAVSLVRALLAHAVVDNSLLPSLASATAAVSPTSAEAFVESFYAAFGDRRDIGSTDTGDSAVNSLLKGILAFFNLRLFQSSTAIPVDSSTDASTTSSSISSGHSSAASRSYCGNPLAARCLSLLLLLLHSNRSFGSSNCFRKVFFLLHDDSIDNTVNDSNEGQGDLEMMISRERGAFVDRIHFDFRDLISGLARTLPTESGVLLLYTFLQSHPTFIDTLACTGGTQLVLCPCLQELYVLTCPKREVCDPDKYRLTVNHLYVMSICVLLIVQDRALLPALCTANNFPIAWYKERNLCKASLLDLCILCTVRAGLHAVFKLRDAYLLSNCAAVLNNIAASSAFTGGLHPHTCDRLVRISLQLSRRVSKGRQDARSDGDGDGRDATSTLIEDFLVVILKFIQSILRPRLLLVNVHLLYTLIHDYENLVQLYLHPSVVSLFFGDERHEEVSPADALLAEQGTLPLPLPRQGSSDKKDEEGRGQPQQRIVFSLPHGLVLIAKHYLDILDVLSVDNFLFSASQAIKLLKTTIEVQAGGAAVFEHCFRGCAVYASDADSSNFCSYSYQEVDCPEEFFLPYIWDFTISQSPEISLAKFKAETT